MPIKKRDKRVLLTLIADFAEELLLLAERALEERRDDAEIELELGAAILDRLGVEVDVSIGPDLLDVAGELLAGARQRLRARLLSAWAVERAPASRETLRELQAQRRRARLAVAAAPILPDEPDPVPEAPSEAPTQSSSTLATWVRSFLPVSSPSAKAGLSRTKEAIGSDRARLSEDGQVLETTR